MECVRDRRRRTVGTPEHTPPACLLAVPRAHRRSAVAPVPKLRFEASGMSGWPLSIPGTYRSAKPTIITSPAGTAPRSSSAAQRRSAVSRHIRVLPATTTDPAKRIKVLKDEQSLVASTSPPRRTSAVGGDHAGGERLGDWFGGVLAEFAHVGCSGAKDQLATTGLTSWFARLGGLGERGALGLPGGAVPALLVAGARTRPPAPGAHAPGLGVSRAR
jgi:hypothetical protein